MESTSRYRNDEQLKIGIFGEKKLIYRQVEIVQL